MRKAFNSLLAGILVMFFLSACGGGGGGGNGGASYTVGGTVSGLSGSGLVLQDNGGDDLTISANGAFTFATKVADVAAYAVTVKTQPSGPLQTCTVNSGSGTMSGANMTNISVVCSTNAYTVSGTVSGLSGSGLVLQDNGGDDLAVSVSGAFSFTTKVADGAAYAVTVKTQPSSPSQICTVNSGTGTISGADISGVTVACIFPKAITAFSFTSPAATGTIDENAKTINVTVPNGTVLANLTPTIVITGVSVSPASGVAQNFSNPVVYTVTAVDSTTAAYTVSVIKRHVVFVTSVQGTGNLSTWADAVAAGSATGLAAGDAVCQARALAAGLTGTFAAWLSDSNNDAYCRLHGLTGKKASNCGQSSPPAFAGPWVRMDGFPFAGTIDQLTMADGMQVYAPVWFDEKGTVLPQNGYFTSTNPDGTASSYDHCSNWTSTVPLLVPVGYSFATQDQWSYTGGDCISSKPLLCFQTGSGPSLPPATTTGKVVFLTSTSGNGNLSTWADAGGNTGIAAGDAICRARAAAGGLANSSKFKAWLSTSAVNAADRFVYNGPWVRPDGVKVAGTKADLTDGSIFTSINQGENGHYLAGYDVWTGTLRSGLKDAQTCADWTDGTTGSKGMVGTANYANYFWTEYANIWTCDGINKHLYCLEDQ